MGGEGGGSGAARRFFVAGHCRLGWVAGLVVAASGIHSLGQWREAESFYTGVIAITAAVILCVGSWHARRPLVEIAGSEVVFRPRYTSPQRLRQSLAEVFGAEARPGSRSLELHTRTGDAIPVPLAALSRSDREAVVAEIQRRIRRP